MVPRPHLAHPFAALCFLACLGLLGVACDKADKITVENVIEQPQPNQPPLIVKQGPEFPPGGFERIALSYPQGIDLWVLVGDPNGLDDISLVAVSVDSVRLSRFLLRPDTSNTGCHQFSYVPNDTIETAAILQVPATFPGVELRPMVQAQGGLHVLQGFGGGGLGFPDLIGASNLLQQWPGGCYNGTTGILGPIVVLPPAVPSELTAILSYADVEYLGISVTVYDKVGASATTSFPDLRLVFTSPEERSAPP